MEVCKKIPSFRRYCGCVYDLRGADGSAAAGDHECIVDDGVLGVNTGGVGDLKLIWALGIRMIFLVLFGGFCGSMNNVFVHLSGQNIGNEMRKDVFRNIMTFSFPQVDRMGTGSLVTRVTNDITQVQNFVS